MGIFFFKLGIIKKNLVLELHRWLSRSSLETNMLKKKSCPFHSCGTGTKSIQDPHRRIKGHLWMSIQKRRRMLAIIVRSVILRDGCLANVMPNMQ